MDPSLQMRGQSPMNCPVSDVKMWGQNLTYCLMTKEKAALIHTLMLLLTNTKLQRTFQYTRKKKGLNSCVRIQPYRKTLMFPFHFLNGFCQLLQSLTDD